MTTHWHTFRQYGIALFFLAAVYPAHMNAQYVIKDNIKTLYDKDSVIIALDDEFRGELQWEISEDLINWTALPGKTQKSLALHVDNSAYYRALITDGTCDPIYSDTVLIAELFDDRDQQFYDIVNISGQWWMAENLKFRSGTGSWFYENDSLRFGVYGRLYNWPAVNSVCPTGWHLPSDDEWGNLEVAVGLDPALVYNTDWRGDNIRDKLIQGGSTGFNMIYAGFRDLDGEFNVSQTAAFFWAGTQAGSGKHWYRGFHKDFGGSHRIAQSDNYGFSVRCVKDDLPVVSTDSVYQVSDTSVMIHGTLLDSRGESIVNRGFCWNTLPDPTIDNNHVIADEAGSGFIAHITGLQPNTVYYIRAFAYSSAGVGYGSSIMFETTPPVPVISTTPVSSLTITSALSGGHIINDKGLQITERGVCWSTSQNPTVYHYKTIDGSGPGIYTSFVTGLLANTKYYLRAYVITPTGTFYGNELTFRTKPMNETGSFTDSRDGKTYTTVKIGYQWWMSENLNIYAPTGSTFYGNDSVKYGENGRLYNILTALNLCPAGWHLPAEDEWQQLELYLGMDPGVIELTSWRGTNEGARLFEGAPEGFNATWAGLLHMDGKYYGYGSIAAYWSSTQNGTSGNYWYRGVNTSQQKIHREAYSNDYMHAIRCVMHDKPVIKTDSVGTIGENTAVAYTSVLSYGGRTITAKGVCWSKSSNPTMADNHTSDGAGNTGFTSPIAGLDQGTTYYLRSYATNDQGTSYSEEVTFKTLPAVPVVSTATVSSITSVSAVSGGQIMDNKGFAITAKGVCWSTTPAPTLADPHTTNGAGNAPFTSSITGLTPNKVYYVRAYATSSAGTGYGNEETFRTKFKYTTATFTDARDGRVYKSIMIGDQLWMAENLNYNKIPGSTFYNNNSEGYQQYGRLYDWQAAMNSCPAGWHLPTDDEWKTLEMEMGMSAAEANVTGWRGTTEGLELRQDGASGFEVLYGGFYDPILTAFKTEGTIGAFWTSTESGSSVWYRGFNTNEARIYRVTFSKNYMYSVRCLRNVLPVLTTAAATGITDTSARSGGTITYDGGVPVTARGVCWSISHSPTIADDSTNNGTGIGSFVSHILGLKPGKTYYARAYATNSEGTSYGNEITISMQTSVPRLTTAAVTSVTDTTAVCGGIITSDGGLTIDAKGVCWSTTQNPTVSNEKTNDGTGTASFVSNLTMLLPNTTYYVRAYATNSNGTGYGNQVAFTTKTSVPKVTTAAITAITDSSATGGGNVTSNGGLSLSARGVCWNTTGNPTIAGNKTNDGTVTGIFTSKLTDLQFNVTYYVRAYATNSLGTGYGSQISFTTSATLPVVTTVSVSAITSTTATSGGNVTSDGGSTIDVKGVCWSTTQNPTVSNEKTNDGTGTASFVSNLTMLLPNTTYYVRAYATNSTGTAYGNQVAFTTLVAVEVPVVTTTAVTDITDNSAVSGGNVTDDGGASLTVKGICWSTLPNPTVSDSKTENGTATGGFTANLTGLSDRTLYYVRAYATNPAGTGYGAAQEFTTTIRTGTTTDARDGQEYATVKIGEDWWMAENLNYSVAGSAYPDNDSATNAEIYGRLYTWSAMMAGAASSDLNPSGVQGICPAGWHIPGNTEWAELITYFGGSAVAGSELKEEGTAYWKNPNNDATNSSGFTARPAGMLMNTLTPAGFEDQAYFWTTTENDGTSVFTKWMSYNSTSVANSALEKDLYHSVRCKKN